MLIQINIVNLLANSCFFKHPAGTEQRYHSIGCHVSVHLMDAAGIFTLYHLLREMSVILAATCCTPFTGLLQTVSSLLCEFLFFLELPAVSEDNAVKL